MERTFKFSALWDEEARVFYSQSDIVGLHIEAKTLDEFEAVLTESAVELIVAHHITATDFAAYPITELVPAILWQRPDPERAAH